MFLSFCGQVQEFGDNFSYEDLLPRAGLMDFEDDVMIYPISQKQLSISPFLQFLHLWMTSYEARPLDSYRLPIQGHSHRNYVRKSF